MLRLDQLDLFVIATQAKWYGPGDALDGIFGGTFAQLSPADRVRFEKGLVVPILLEDGVHHAQCEGSVGGGVGLDVQIGGTR